MGKQILIILVVIGLMLLAVMPTASSDANDDGKVWSDGYVELTLNKMERTDTVPPEFIRSPLERARPPEEGHDFVVINLTLTRIEGRYVLFGHSSILFDDKGDDYTFNYTLVQGVTLRTETGEPANFSDPNVKYYEANEGSKWLFLSEMPKDREPVRLRFIYNFTESWENVFIKEGQIEVEFEEKQNLMEGDVTMDKHVTMADAMFIAQYKAGLRSLNASQLQCADTTDDGDVTMADAMHIAQWKADPDGTLGVLFKPLWSSEDDADLLKPVDS